ncbi:unnamed protein product (macronuclear) [Paramecium tetraurelia]|uniref:Peptidase S1 domain-containing protein n=1 Tax=Paramecium tetraurelia TaxID=5888 RepID=A0DB82_PARTE|nr:uncharacterized protein GSPATT00015193001 [Paramecium tetraurelia]CAK80299.1 unnamed protein product [Paramecium tetraurelia]|eukprot:XP_001447696.1 hypothetical protein (macronuclear) [Paramecium tetraurelia strain d4-2]
MLTQSILSVESSKVYKPKTSQIGLLSTAISKLGDSNYTTKTRESTNMSPVRMRLFRDSSPKQSKGLQGVVVGEYHALTPAHVVFSSIHKSTSPIRSNRNYNESPQRAKVRLDRFKNWDSKLGLELQIQNTKFTRLNNELSFSSYQPHHLASKSSVFLGNNQSRLGFGGHQSDIRLLSAKLNAIPPTQIGAFTVGHNHELADLQQSLTRILKQSRQY